MKVKKKQTLTLPDFSLEIEQRSLGRLIVAGTDEAGRGCLAGPVVAAAVILPEDAVLDRVRDSKTVAEDERQELAEVVRSTAIAWATASCSPKEIDSLNILWASMEAMLRAVASLKQQPDVVLTDGNHVPPETPVPWLPVVKGDARSLSIAAASILAKVERDRIMLEHAQKHPQYGWDSNVGYPTQHHYEALAEFGATELHRKSFRLFDTQYDLFAPKVVPPVNQTTRTSAAISDDS